MGGGTANGREKLEKQMPKKTGYCVFCSLLATFAVADKDCA
jgi:hypothetical protein